MKDNTETLLLAIGAGLAGVIAIITGLIMYIQVQEPRVQPQIQTVPASLEQKIPGEIKLI